MGGLALVAMLAASVLGRNPSFPNSGDPCKDSCSMLSRVCFDACAKKARGHKKVRMTDAEMEQAAKHGKLDMGQMLPDNPKACRAECTDQVKSCRQACPTMKKAMKDYKKKR